MPSMRKPGWPESGGARPAASERETLIVQATEQLPIRSLWPQPIQPNCRAALDQAPQSDLIGKMARSWPKTSGYKPERGIDLSMAAVTPVSPIGTTPCVVEHLPIIRARRMIGTVPASLCSHPIGAAYPYLRTRRRIPSGATLAVPDRTDLSALDSVPCGHGVRMQTEHKTPTVA